MAYDIKNRQRLRKVIYADGKVIYYSQKNGKKSLVIYPNGKKYYYKNYKK